MKAKCSQCKYCEAYRTHGARGQFFCKHPDINKAYESYQKEKGLSHINKASYAIGFGYGAPNMRSCLRWCPLNRKEAKR